MSGATCTMSGSSPHTRGALGDASGRGRRRGIIPAYAGSTSGGFRRRRGLWDHPRIRGEHSAVSIAKGEAGGSSPHTRGALPERVLADGPGVDHPRIRGEHAALRSILRMSPGSSPHTRGARNHDVLREVEGRIIPAYAGSTVRNSFRYNVASGSSPHTRGAQMRNSSQIRHDWIIPAYAGSTGSGVFDPPRGRDHPRIRGEHSDSSFV